jgi:hypothetical protein
MTTKTANLIGAALDWAVAKLNQDWSDDDILANLQEDDDGGFYSPSTNWAQGGPLIEWEEICTKRQLPCSAGYEWNAWIWTKHIVKGGSSAGGSGPTPLIAAMRCLVASKLGDEVEVPDELV